MSTLLRVAFALLLTAAQLAAGQIKVATLNCNLYFDPSLQHSGQVASEHPMTADQFTSKTANLIQLAQGYSFIALQEVGGRSEVETLANAAGYQFAFAKGKDSYTGEEVGAIYQMPGWRVSVHGRVADLDSILSKHLLVSAENKGKKVYFLVIHLIRPIGANAKKHQRQLDAVSKWASDLSSREPNSSIVILGDSNDSSTFQSGTLFGDGTEAGALISFQATHIANKPFDRLVLVGPGKWGDVEVARPPYGKRPNDLQKLLWTDHYLLGATLSFQ